MLLSRTAVYLSLEGQEGAKGVCYFKDLRYRVILSSLKGVVCKPCRI